MLIWGRNLTLPLAPPFTVERPPAIKSANRRKVPDTTGVYRGKSRRRESAINTITYVVFLNTLFRAGWFGRKHFMMSSCTLCRSLSLVVAFKRACKQCVPADEMRAHLKTAKALSLNVPNTLVGRADELIECGHHSRGNQFSGAAFMIGVLTPVSISVASA